MEYVSASQPFLGQLVDEPVLDRSSCSKWRRANKSPTLDPSLSWLHGTREVKVQLRSVPDDIFLPTPAEGKSVVAAEL